MEVARSKKERELLRDNVVVYEWVCSQQMGVPVGMPHVVLQTASGPPQVYRIVLEPSVPTSTPQSGPSLQAPAPILAQALSGDPVTHLTAAASTQHLAPHPSHPHHTHTVSQVRHNIELFCLY